MKSYSWMIGFFINVLYGRINSGILKGKSLLSNAAELFGEIRKACDDN